MCSQVRASLPQQSVSLSLLRVSGLECMVSLPQLDADQDGQLSLREIEAIRSEFAAKAGWWMPPVAQ